MYLHALPMASMFGTTLAHYALRSPRQDTNKLRGVGVEKQRKSRLIPSYIALRTCAAIVRTLRNPEYQTTLRPESSNPLNRTTQHLNLRTLYSKTTPSQQVTLRLQTFRVDINQVLLTCAGFHACHGENSVAMGSLWLQNLEAHDHPTKGRGVLTMAHMENEHPEATPWSSCSLTNGPDG